MAENVGLLYSYAATRFPPDAVELVRDVISGYGRLRATVEAWPPETRTGRLPTTAEAMQFARSYRSETAGGGAA